MQPVPAPPQGWAWTWSPAVSSLPRFCESHLLPHTPQNSQFPQSCPMEADRCMVQRWGELWLVAHRVDPSLPLSLSKC